MHLCITTETIAEILPQQDVYITILNQKQITDLTKHKVCCIKYHAIFSTFQARISL